MNILIVLLTILDVMIAALLIGLILVQQSKSSGLGTTFGGGGSDSLFGAHASSHLVKLTVVFASCFLVITLSLAIITAHRPKDKSVAEIASDISAGVKADETKIEKKGDKAAQTPAPTAQVPAGDKPGMMQQQFKLDPATGQLVPVGEMTPAPATPAPGAAATPAPAPAPGSQTTTVPGGTVTVTPIDQKAAKDAKQPEKPAGNK